MSQINDENVNPYTLEVYEIICKDLQAHSNHFLTIDANLVDKINKITCHCSDCDLIKIRVTKLSTNLHDEIVRERTQDIPFLTGKIKMIATEICQKVITSLQCKWNR
jgi:hypothetical protein